jgi:hypothetical protein
MTPSTELLKDETRIRITCGYRDKEIHTIKDIVKHNCSPYRTREDIKWKI